MRLLLVTHYGAMLGANRSMLQVAGGYAAAGIAATLVCPPRSPVAAGAAEVGLDVVEAPIPYNCGRPGGRSAAIRWVLKSGLPSFARRRRCDRPSRRAAEHLLPRLRRPVDLVYTNASVTDVGHFAAHALGVPHCWHLREFGDLDYGLRACAGRAAARRRLMRTTCVVAISRAVLAHHCPGHPNARVIDNGVVDEATLDRLRRARRERKELGRPLKIVVLGVIHEAKNQAEAVTAFATALPELLAAGRDPTLYVVGPGDTDHLEAAAVRLGVGDRVRFPGSVEDPLGLLSGTDVLLVPSHCEGFGRVTVEAMACGAVVAAKATGGTPEVVRNGRDGFLYEGGADAAARALIRAATADASVVREAAWRSVADRFTVERVRRAVYETLRETADRGMFPA